MEGALPRCDTASTRGIIPPTERLLRCACTCSTPMRYQSVSRAYSDTKTTKQKDMMEHSSYTSSRYVSDWRVCAWDPRWDLHASDSTKSRLISQVTRTIVYCGDRSWCSTVEIWNLRVVHDSPEVSGLKRRFNIFFHVQPFLAYTRLLWFIGSSTRVQGGKMLL